MRKRLNKGSWERVKTLIDILKVAEWQVKTYTFVCFESLGLILSTDKLTVLHCFGCFTMFAAKHANQHTCSEILECRFNVVSRLEWFRVVLFPSVSRTYWRGCKVSRFHLYMSFSKFHDQF